MNRNQKIILSMLVLAVLSISAAATAVQGALNGQLANPGSITIKGSSTVYPVANEQAGVWNNYWNGLVAANPSWGASTNTLPVNLEGLGSGTACSALAGNTADVGEMSRPPNSASSEWGNPTLTNLQIWAIGLDSVAIVLSPDMTWFPTGLTTMQVHDIFASAPSTGGSAYVTWGDFFTAQGISTTGITPAQLAEPITRVVREPTSGTFDCFNTYFGNPNGPSFQHKDSNGNADGSQNMAAYTLAPENINVYNDVSTGTGTIGFISAGYNDAYGNNGQNMIALNIAFNIATGTQAGLIAAYPGAANFHPTWSQYYAPSRANIINAFSNANTASKYWAWRYLWEVTPNSIPSTGNLLQTGVWISYMIKPGTTNSGNSQFILDQYYIPLDRADFAGKQVIDGSLANYNPVGTQTTQIPDGKCNFNDIGYFVSNYIAYTSLHIYNPYCDMNADGKINFNDVGDFVSTYVAYYTQGGWYFQ